jgi:hypothetical protein
MCVCVQVHLCQWCSEAAQPWTLSWQYMHLCTGPCIDVDLPDGAPEEVDGFFGRMLHHVVRQEYWAHSSILLNAPGRQQSVRQLLKAAGFSHYMCDPVPGDTRVLLLPCAAPVRGLDRYWVPFRPQLSAAPCLTRECNVKHVYHSDTFREVHFTPPLAYNYKATQQPGTPECQRDVLELATPGLGRDCKLQLRSHQRHAPLQDATQLLGGYLLVHGVAVDVDMELVPLEQALDALEAGGEVPPEMMMMGGGADRRPGGDHGGLGSLVRDGRGSCAHQVAHNPAHAQGIHGKGGCEAHVRRVQALEVEEGGRVEPRHSAGQAAAAAEG